MKTKANDRLASLDAAYDHVAAALDALRGARPDVHAYASLTAYEAAARAHRCLERDADDLLGQLAAEMRREEKAGKVSRR